MRRDMRIKSVFLGNNVLQLETLIKNSDVKAIFTRDDANYFNFLSLYASRPKDRSQSAGQFQ